MSPGLRMPRRTAPPVPRSLPCIHRTAEVIGKRPLFAISCMPLRTGPAR